MRKAAPQLPPFFLALALVLLPAGPGALADPVLAAEPDDPGAGAPVPDGEPAAAPVPAAKADAPRAQTAVDAAEEAPPPGDHSAAEASGAVEGAAAEAATEDDLPRSALQAADRPDSKPGDSFPDSEAPEEADGSGILPNQIGVAIDTLTAAPVEAVPVPLAEAVTAAGERNAVAPPLSLLGTEVPPGTYQRLAWSATELFEGVPIASPVLVVNGTLPGPTLCLAAAVHGDELNGIEMVRRVMHGLNPQKLSGAVVGVPIVNLQGFRRGSRYLPDRRDLNRYFPGNPLGSAASRIAHSFFTEVVRHCDALVDLHTGSFERANLPQLRADLRNPDVVTLTQGFGATVILHSVPAEGTLRRAATEAGIATVTLEAGGPSELELQEVMHGVKGIETLLNTLGMVRKTRLWGDPEPVYYRSVWVRANRGGILLADVSLGSTVRRGDLLGTITDPMNNSSTNLYAPFSGRVIGMARNQVVMPGFAAFHVGYQTDQATADAGGSAGRRNAYIRDAELAHEDYVDDMSE